MVDVRIVASCLQPKLQPKIGGTENFEDAFLNSITKYTKQFDGENLWWMHTSPWWANIKLEILDHKKESFTSKSQVRLLLTKLKVCSDKRDLPRGIEVHVEAVESGSVSSIYVATALVNMYAKCGKMAEAQEVFDNIGKPDVVVWTALILGYAENGEGFIALQLFAKMKTVGGCAPNNFSFVAALKACTSIRNGIEKVQEIHAEVGCHMDAYVQNTLIDMYAKCGNMNLAHDVFLSLKRPDVISWTTMILGYVDNGESLIALDLFSKMKTEGCTSNHFTFVAALKACTNLALQYDKRECLQRGREIHSQIGSQLNAYVQSTLIEMYAKCGSLLDARIVFDNIKHPDAVSWTSIIVGYAENGDSSTALELFAKMRFQGCGLRYENYVSALKLCSFLASDETIANARAEFLEWGKKVHLHIGNSSNKYVQSSLLDMYTKCGSMENARNVFASMKHPDVVAWTTMILGYADNGQGAAALEYFAKMKSQGCAPDSFCFVAAIKACAAVAVEQDVSGKPECLEQGRDLHSQIGCHVDLYVQSALIDMYAKCGSMVDAKDVFDSIKQPDVVSWTALILGYAENGEGLTALNLFGKMKSRGCLPSTITFVAALKACGLLGALESGIKIHAEMDMETESNPMIVTCLVDFYSKCGCLDEAQRVFNLHSQTRDMTSWNALLTGYSGMGDSSAVFRLFERMQDAGIPPTPVTILCILTCCGQAGLVEKARVFFEAMPNYGLTPTIRHYCCIVDILGRSGKLDDALALLQSMPGRPNAIAWMPVLDACRKLQNLGVGWLAFRSVVSLMNSNDSQGAPYVLMGQIYRSKGMWEEQEIVLGMRKISNAWKIPGEACWTNQLGEVHTFLHSRVNNG